MRHPWHARQFRPKVGSRNFDCVLTLAGSSRNKIPASPLRALDRPALTTCGGYGIGCDSAAHQPGAKNHVTTSQSRKLKLGTMTVMITRAGDTYHVRPRKSTPLYDEDHIQLQILEHQLRYYGFQQRGAAGSEYNPV
jgi:hypothetical protein